ncbi:beta-lactamase/transpeptidase-like protein [Triangularia verruculosa]|uniref:Beta-lactamase/transpeptidase-like protein n=1 Tax=Triangularia verruculosa TaxID=2587418 RepID=A0AAN6XLQ4_9PEZI|nr:beta-lactamase/transpeptidase-like protein [Triangularia verruculosa]
MGHFVNFVVLAVLAAKFKVSWAALNGHCPPLGPVLPPPVSASTSPAVAASVATFQQLMDEFTAQYNHSAVAIGLKSIHEDSYLVEYAFTPPNRDSRGAQQVDSDTVFRIASVSKIFPVLAILKLHGVSLEDPVTKYVPELLALNNQARENNAIWTVAWEEITLGALASHLAGIGVDMMPDYTPFGDFTPYGFPPVNESRLLGCSGFFGLPECNRTVFFERFGERAPVQLPFSPNAVYSNAAFAILGFVVEAITNRSLNEFIETEIWRPLNMTSTFATKPDDALGFIPTDDIWWNATLGYGDPAGSVYSTINDMTRFGEAILRHELGLSASQTRKWLKPLSQTSSSGTLVGAPWEIYRIQNATTDGRLIELYTKGGDLITYHSVFALIPDYDLVATIMVVGALEANEARGIDATVFLSKLVEIVLPGVEEAGRNEADIAYGGTYHDEATNSSITLTQDDGPGFNIESWIVRGVDVIATWLGFSILPNPIPPTSNPLKFRLYPTTVQTRNQTSWRSVSQIGLSEDIAKLENLLLPPQTMCVTWGQLDRATYMLQAQDHLVFTLDEQGRATKVELVGYAVSLSRQQTPA